MDALQAARFLLAAALVLLAPGCALLAWLDVLPGQQASSNMAALKRSGLSTFADAIALSIAIPALLALWLFVFGIRVSGLAVAGLYGLCLLLLLAAFVKRRVRLPGLDGWLAGLLGVLFVAGLIAWRFYQARTLVMPAWVDSVQHALITRKIYEYGGVPPDLTPYLPAPFFYHYGYHLIAALFVFWSRLPISQATLWFGQVLNALVAISVYRAAEAFSNRLAGGSQEGDLPEAGEAASPGTLRRAAPLLAAVLAALLVGFDFQMPAYYVTWGRYTLLTGLLLLGPVLAAAIDVHDRPLERSGWVRLVLLVAGACLTHYLVLLLVALFLVVLGLASLARGYRSREGWLTLARLAGLSLLGVLLAAPWVWRVWFYNQQMAQLSMILPQEQSEVAYNNSLEYLKYLVYLIGPRRNHILLGIAGVGVLVAAMRPRWYAFAGWALLLGLLTLPWGLRIGPFRPDHFGILLFFPAAVLVAELVVTGAIAVERVIHPWVGLAALVVVSGLFLAWGLRDTRSVINSATVFTTPADVAALDWVNENTPPTARFYNNSVLWQGQTYRGVDGGAWLLPYTGRYSLVPPISYIWESPDNFKQINDWAARSTKLQGCTPEFWALIREANLNYIYLRQGQGGLEAKQLVGCQGLQKVYDQDGVVIYEILQR